MIPIAFDIEQQNHVDKNKINWKKMIDKTIIKKCKTIFIALDWDLSLIKEVKNKKN